MVSISLFFHMILIQKICSFSKDHALTIQPRGQSSSTPAQPCIRNTKRLADVLFPVAPKSGMFAPCPICPYLICQRLTHSNSA
jgi:hypothetical protein